jgi:hypothetical protein
MNQMHWSSVGEVSVRYNVNFTPILGPYQPKHISHSDGPSEASPPFSSPSIPLVRMTVMQASLRCKYVNKLDEPLDENQIVEISYFFIKFNEQI